MKMTHSERRKWVTIISEMNKHINDISEYNYKERFKELINRKER